MSVKKYTGKYSFIVKFSDNEGSLNILSITSEGVKLTHGNVSNIQVLGSLQEEKEDGWNEITLKEHEIL